MDARLLPHNALNIYFVWIVLIFYQGCLNGLLESIWINWKVILWDKDVNFFVVSIYIALEFDRFGRNFILRCHFLILLLDRHIECFGNDLTMSPGRW